MFDFSKRITNSQWRTLFLHFPSSSLTEKQMNYLTEALHASIEAGKFKNALTLLKYYPLAFSADDMRFPKGMDELRIKDIIKAVTNIHEGASFTEIALPQVVFNQIIFILLHERPVIEGRLDFGDHPYALPAHSFSGLTFRDSLVLANITQWHETVLNGAAINGELFLGFNSHYVTRVLLKGFAVNCMVELENTDPEGDIELSVENIFFKGRPDIGRGLRPTFPQRTNLAMPEHFSQYSIQKMTEHCPWVFDTLKVNLSTEQFFSVQDFMDDPSHFRKLLITCVLLCKRFPNNTFDLPSLSTELWMRIIADVLFGNPEVNPFICGAKLLTKTGLFTSLHMVKSFYRQVAPALTGKENGEPSPLKKVTIPTPARDTLRAPVKVPFYHHGAAAAGPLQPINFNAPPPVMGALI